MHGRTATTLIYDEALMLPKDTLAMIQADQAFLQRLVDRLAKRELADTKRMWMGREEIRNLRRLAKQKVSNEWLRLQNRRMRVSTVKQYIAYAEDHLAARAAALVADKIARPEIVLRYDDVMDTGRWSQSLLQQLKKQSPFSIPTNIP